MWIIKKGSKLPSLPPLTPPPPTAPTVPTTLAYLSDVTVYNAWQIWPSTKKKKKKKLLFRRFTLTDIRRVRPFNHVSCGRHDTRQRPGELPPWSRASMTALRQKYSCSQWLLRRKKEKEASTEVLEIRSIRGSHVCELRPGCCDGVAVYCTCTAKSGGPTPHVKWSTRGLQHANTPDYHTTGLRAARPTSLLERVSPARSLARSLALWLSAMGRCFYTLFSCLTGHRSLAWCAWILSHT